MTEIDFLIIRGMIIIFLSVKKRLVVISFEYGFYEENISDRDRFILVWIILSLIVSHSWLKSSSVHLISKS